MDKTADMRDALTQTGMVPTVPIVPMVAQSLRDKGADKILTFWKRKNPNKTGVFRGFQMEPAIGFEPMTS